MDIKTAANERQRFHKHHKHLEICGSSKERSVGMKKKQMQEYRTVQLHSTTGALHVLIQYNNCIDTCTDETDSFIHSFRSFL